jgi:hypothetical protein
VSSWPRPKAAGSGPGAILVGYTDISSAAPGELHQTFQKPIAAEATAVETTSPTPARAVRPPRASDVRTARMLDAGVGRPAGAAWSVWDVLSSCESGQNWSANTGNGFVGGLQFLPETWRAHGGTTFAPSAELASREQQIAIAERVLASQGWGAWPACSARLGLAGTR